MVVSNRNLLFQGSIFRGKLLVLGSVNYIIYFFHSKPRWDSLLPVPQAYARSPRKRQRSRRCLWRCDHFQRKSSMSFLPLATDLLQISINHIPHSLVRFHLIEIMETNSFHSKATHPSFWRVPHVRFGSHEAAVPAMAEDISSRDFDFYWGSF